MAAKKASAPETSEVSAAEAPAPVRKPWTLASNGPAPAVEYAPDEPAEHGFRGVQVDQTPNEHYTVAGQLAAQGETP